MKGRLNARKRNSERAQTGIDFLVGMSVFLIAVGFVFAFVPSMFAPFGGTGVNDALIADRSAAYLAEYALVEDPSNSGVLSAACTAAFFDEGGALNRTEIDSEYGCNFDPEEIDDLTALLGIQGWKNVQITIGEPDNVVYEDENGTYEIEMQRGEDPSSGSGSDTVSRRVVSINGEPYELRVRVW